jgi:hypothetical protein
LAQVASNTKTAHPVDIASIGSKIVTVIFLAVIVCIVLAALVYAGRITQKGPYGRSGRSGRPM